MGALGARPWEYLACAPRRDRGTREDCVLVVDAMSATLETDGSDERARAAIAQTYGEETLAFLRPLVTERSAALDGSTAPAPPVPDAAHFTARPFGPGEGRAGAGPDDFHRPVADRRAAGFQLLRARGRRRAAGGAALVANDPHLHLAVPNLWYRASLALPDGTATGATLPGVPALVLGSNGHVAWDSPTATSTPATIVVIEVDPADAGRYRVPDGSGWEPFEVVRESVAVHGGASETCEVWMTRWGPLVLPTR